MLSSAPLTVKPRGTPYKNICKVREAPDRGQIVLNDSSCWIISASIIDGTNMSDSYTNLLYHIVFSTKERRPLITPDYEPRLYEYMGGTLRGIGGVS
jgi:hypothetical protein